MTPTLGLFYKILNFLLTKWRDVISDFCEPKRFFLQYPVISFLNINKSHFLIIHDLIFHVNRCFGKKNIFNFGEAFFFVA